MHQQALRRSSEEVGADFGSMGLRQYFAPKASVSFSQILMVEPDDYTCAFHLLKFFNLGFLSS